MKSKSELVYGTVGDVQVVLHFHGSVVADAFYQHTKRPNLVGLVATTKITEVTGTRVFAALPNGAMGWLETKQKLKAGDIVRARVSSYVSGAKAWPMKLAGDAVATPAPSLLERTATLLPLTPVREDTVCIADWLTDRTSTQTLADGASLLIEQTAAAATIDLNSGRQKNTAQLIAAFGPAIADIIRRYQLGGAIIIDAAFMAPAARKGLAEKIKKHLSADPLKGKVVSVTKMGFIEITRPRMGPSLFDAHGAS